MISYFEGFDGASDGRGVRQGGAAMLASILRTRPPITVKAGTLGFDERRRAAHRYSEISATHVHFFCQSRGAQGESGGICG